jgi:hypothetical protein
VRAHPTKEHCAMPDSPRPLWPGYDDQTEDDLLDLLDENERKAGDAGDDTVRDGVPGGLAIAIATHEKIKEELGAENYRPRLHARAQEIADGWQPLAGGWQP